MKIKRKVLGKAIPVPAKDKNLQAMPGNAAWQIAPVDELVKSLPFQGRGCGFEPRPEY